MEQQQLTDNVKIKFDNKGFDIIKKALSDNYKTRVGILGANGSRVHEDSDLTMAEIGAIHELGSISDKIPARSFIKMPLELKAFEWIKDNKDRYFKYLKLGKIKQFYKDLGFGAEDIINQAFTSSGFGAWLPLKPSTIKKKGSSMPLLDTGALRGSISSTVLKDDK